MASNINVRRDDEPYGRQMMPKPSRSDWEPARVVRALLSWDPFREMSPSLFGNEPQRL